MHYSGCCNSYQLLSIRYHNQIVAIKVLNGGSTPDEKVTLQARFIREVNMMSRVQHENLVKVSVCSIILKLLMISDI